MRSCACVRESIHGKREWMKNKTMTVTERTFLISARACTWYGIDSSEIGINQQKK